MGKTLVILWHNYSEIFNLDVRPELDRAFRALRAQPGPAAPPRQLILKLHHSSVLEDIMKKVANKINLGTTYESSETTQPKSSRKEHSSPSRESILRDIQDLRYGLMYPAKLRVTYKGTERFFTDPEEALKFAQETAHSKDK